MTAKKNFKKINKNHKELGPNAKKAVKGTASVMLGATLMGSAKPIKKIVSGKYEDEIGLVVKADTLEDDTVEETNTVTVEESPTDAISENTSENPNGEALVQQQEESDQNGNQINEDTEQENSQAGINTTTDLSDASDSSTVTIDSPPSTETDNAGSSSTTDETGENQTNPSTESDTEKDESGSTEGKEDTGSTGEKENQKDQSSTGETGDGNKTGSTEDKKKVPVIDISDIDIDKIIGKDPEELKKLEDLDTYLKYVADNHPLGIAGIFHIFGIEVNSSTHIAGNIAIDSLNTGNFGTHNEALTNLIIGDIHYINGITNLTQIDGENRKLIIFGPNVEYRAKENEPNRIEVLVNGEWKTFNIPYKHVLKTDQELNILDKLQELGKKSDEWFTHEQTTGVKVEDNVIDLSGVELVNGEPIYVNIDADYIAGNNKHDFVIKGIPAGISDPIIILNVKSENDALTLNSNMTLEYRDGTNVTHSGEKHDQYNKLLWNFGTSLKTLTVGGDYHLGSILAPNTHVIAKVNVDGNIIAKKLTLEGETHRWDLIPPLEEVEIPDQPTDPQPTQPTDPQPTDPQPSQPTDPQPSQPTDPQPTQPTDPQPTDPQPTQPTTPNIPEEEDFTPPLSEEEPGSEYPDQPEEEEQDEKRVTPHAPETPTASLATAHSDKSAATGTETPETVSTETTEVVEKTQNEEALPETGEHNKNEVATLLASLAAALGITGLAGTSKKRKKKDE